jgi:hypothetical protein
MSPPYPQNGSGWWRSRFIYAAFVGSVLLTEKHEADQLGTAYRYPQGWIEQMTDEQLAQLSMNQREALWPTLTGKDAFTRRVQQVVLAAQQQDTGGEPDGRQVTMACQSQSQPEWQPSGGDVLTSFDMELEQS